MYVFQYLRPWIWKGLEVNWPLWLTLLFVFYLMERKLCRWLLVLMLTSTLWLHDSQHNFVNIYPFTFVTGFIQINCFLQFAYFHHRQTQSVLEDLTQSFLRVGLEGSLSLISLLESGEIQSWRIHLLAHLAYFKNGFSCRLRNLTFYLWLIRNNLSFNSFSENIVST